MNFQDAAQAPRTLNDLTAEQKSTIKNAEAAVRIWKELKERGTTVGASTKFKNAHKKYRELCLSHGITPSL
jgi:hypothetical protein